MTRPRHNSICSAGEPAQETTGPGCACASCAVDSICPPVIRRSQHWLTAKAAPNHLGISRAYTGLLLKRGIIPGTQAAGSMWWVDPEVLNSKVVHETLRALSEQRLVIGVTTIKPSEFRV
jgi:hypothetical protein